MKRAAREAAAREQRTRDTKPTVSKFASKRTAQLRGEHEGATELADAWCARCLCKLCKCGVRWRDDEEEIRLAEQLGAAEFD